MEKFLIIIAIFYLFPAVLAVFAIAFTVREEGIFTVTDLLIALYIIFIPILNGVFVCWCVWDKIESTFSKLIPKIDMDKILWSKKK